MLKVAVAVYVSLIIAVSGLNFIHLPILATSAVAHASTRAQVTSHTDTVLVMDNVDKIEQHDPSGYRFDAAQLYVDLAPPGDRIGLVEITGSPANPPSFPMIDATDPAAKQTIKAEIQQIRKNGVDTRQTAYFTSALKAAGKLLSPPIQGHSRNINIITDALAFSGDTDTSCGAPTHQQWICEVASLESQGISVSLLTFTPAGREDEFAQTSTALKEFGHGATARPVTDGASMPELARAYTDLLTATHPDIFSAELDGTPAQIQITAGQMLDRLTFVALGGDSVSLASLRSPAGVDIVANNNNGNIYPASGRGYNLYTINSNQGLVGSWQLSPSTGVSVPTNVIIIGQSLGKFLLLNPGPSGDDNSSRYVALNKPLALLASMNGVDGNPLNGVTLSASFQGEQEPLTANGLPGIAPNLGVVLGTAQEPSPGMSTTPLLINLGGALSQTSAIGLTKFFQIEPRSDLQGQGVRVVIPAAKGPLMVNTDLTIGAQTTGNASVQKLAIYGRDSSANAGWTMIPGQSPGNAGVTTGSFPLTRGCGNIYTFAAIGEISGSINNASYDYLAYDQGDYRSQLQSAITMQVTPTTPAHLEWWSTQAGWNIKVNSTLCTNQTMSVAMKLKGNDPSVSPLTLLSAPSITVNGNNTTPFPIVAKLGGCMPGLIDKTAVLQLIPGADLPSGASLQEAQPASWSTIVTCPSIFSNSIRYWPLGLPIWFVISILLARLIQLPLAPIVPKTHLSGQVEVAMNALVATASTNGQNIISYEPIAVKIPSTHYADAWYLERHLEDGEPIYELRDHEVPGLSLLKFSILAQESGYHIGVSATRYATGENLPQFFVTGTVIADEPIPCEGDIMVHGDLIYPDLKVSL
jgi:hypothetical protein